MVFVFFIYGLAFFTLGLSILVYPKKGSAFRLANKLWLIAAFGIAHGVSEWIDMFILIQLPTESTYLKIIHLSILPVSFLMLLQFGSEMITDITGKYSGLKAFPLAMPAAWVIIAIATAGNNRFPVEEITARYILGIPGIFLTSIALALEASEYRKAKIPHVGRYLWLAAVTFFFYGFFSGLVVPEADFFPASVLNYRWFIDRVGAPVQIFRALSAVFVTFSMIRVLSVFDWETRTKLAASEKKPGP